MDWMKEMSMGLEKNWAKLREKRMATQRD